jgi:16S rRNA (adenine(1408)-N(1))-methyltransferase
MAESSLRASRSAVRGGIANAVFVVAGVESLPTDLAGFADLVTIRFPWGSLLRGAVGVDEGMTAAIARLLTPGGSLEITLSITTRDASSGAGESFGATDMDRTRAAFDGVGLRLVEARQLGPEAARALSSSWARRIRAGAERPAWQLRFERDPRPR